MQPCQQHSPGLLKGARQAGPLRRRHTLADGLPTCRAAHLVALHFSPASVGQEPCVEAESSSPFGLSE